MNNERGITLIDVLIAMGLTCFVAAASAYALTYAVTSQRLVNYRIAVATTRTNLINILARDDAFRKTLMQSVFAVAAGGTNDFAVLDANSNVVYDPRIPENGFLPGPLPTGQATCSTFGLSAQPECPIRANVQWSVVCAACTPIMIQVDVSFLLHVNGTTIDASKYNFSIIRPQSIP